MNTEPWQDLLEDFGYDPKEFVRVPEEDKITKIITQKSIGQKVFVVALEDDVPYVMDTEEYFVSGRMAFFNAKQVAGSGQLPFSQSGMWSATGASGILNPINY